MQPRILSNIQANDQYFTLDPLKYTSDLNCDPTQYQFIPAQFQFDSNFQHDLAAIPMQNHFSTTMLLELLTSSQNDDLLLYPSPPSPSRFEMVSIF